MNKNAFQLYPAAHDLFFTGDKKNVLEMLLSPADTHGVKARKKLNRLRHSHSLKRR